MFLVPAPVCVSATQFVSATLGSAAATAGVLTPKVQQSLAKSGVKTAFMGAKNFRSFANLLKFTLPFAPTAAWSTWIDDDSNIDTVEDSTAMNLLIEKLKDPGVKQRAEQKLALLMEDGAEKVEQLQWEDLQILTQITFARPTVEGLTCPKPKDLKARKADVATFLGASERWGKEEK